MAGGRRLGLEHVQRRPAQPLRFERLRQRHLVDQAAAGAVDEQRARLHLRELRRRDHVPRLLVERDVQGHGIAAAEDLRQGHQLDPELGCRFLAEEGIEGDHLHAERLRPLHDEGADVSRSHHPERLAEQLAPRGELLLLPLARARALRGVGDLPRERKEQRDGVLCDRDAVAPGRVHHHHAAAGGRIEIDVVHARSGPPDHPQPRRRREELGRDLGGAPHRQRVVSARDLAQLGRLEADADVDLRIRDPLEDDLRLRRQIIGNEDAHQRPPANDCWAAARPAPSWTLAPRSCRPRSIAPITTSMSKSSK